MKRFLPFFVMPLYLLLSSSSRKESPAEISRQLYYPVTGSKAKVGSVWGDERDGGRRRHEGIDIFAAKGTPLVAISDGIIEVVGNDNIGGINITLQPHDYEWEAYYAHLDQVHVISGQRVKKGQLIGTVGNTGNAKTTPPHLHFGIYTNNGAVDPLPYLNSSPRLSLPVQVTHTETAKAPAPKKASPPSAPKSNGNKQVETEIKNTAVRVITGELLRRIKIRL